MLVKLIYNYWNPAYNRETMVISIMEATCMGKVGPT